jgi:bifunctional DNA-binding transcriptional regulator/antitoxin component of YhaV-PrlF toxin-antitoxin module
VHVELTKVVVAQTKSKSLRTTIPAGIARQFDLSEDSELGWEIEARNNELRIVVRPFRSQTTAPTKSEKRRNLSKGV